MEARSTLNSDPTQRVRAWPSESNLNPSHAEGSGGSGEALVARRRNLRVNEPARERRLGLFATMRYQMSPDNVNEPWKHSTRLRPLGVAGACSGGKSPGTAVWRGIRKGSHGGEVATAPTQWHENRLKSSHIIRPTRILNAAKCCKLQTKAQTNYPIYRCPVAPPSGTHNAQMPGLDMASGQDS